MPPWSQMADGRIMTLLDPAQPEDGWVILTHDEHLAFFAHYA